MTDKLKQLQQERKAQRRYLDLLLEASAEAKEAMREFLEQDIEMADALLEIGVGSEASDGRRMPGNMSAAEINRDMIRNVRSAVIAARWDYRVATRQIEGEKIGYKLRKSWRNILDS